MERTSTFPVIELSGTPRERGRIHGESLRDLVFEAVQSWKYILQLTQPPVGKTIDALVNHSDFLAAARRYTPGLVEEVEGIAEGANLPFNEIFALQLMDEGCWFERQTGASDLDRCTSLGSNRSPEHPAILAQNLDWKNIFTNFQVIFRLKDENSGVKTLIPSIPGVLGTCGLNNKGIGICTNALWHFLQNSTEGLPVNFIVRAVLEKTRLADAFDFIQSVPHASGENYVLSDFDQVLDYECSANQVRQFTPFKDAQVVYHTNHPLVNDDLIYPPVEAGPSTFERLKYLEFRMKGTDKHFSLESVKAILRSHYGPICRHQSFSGISVETKFSVIYVLNDPPELLITNGPPCSSEYQRYTF